MEEKKKVTTEKEKLMSITEVASLLMIETHVLRYWEDEFGLKIKRSETGRRMYSQEDLKRFKTIIDCKRAGMKIKEMKEKKDIILQSDDTPLEKGEVDKASVNKFIIKPNTYQSEKKTAVMQQALSLENSNLPEYEQKLQRLQELMVQVLTKSVQANLEEIKDSMTEELKETLQKELDFQFREFEDRQAELEEKHYRELDSLLRSRISKRRKKLMQ